MSAHTPGPWEVKMIGSTRADVVANGQVVARTAPVVPREAEPANARLIAAAPLMYEELARIYTEEGSALKPETCSRLLTLLAQVHHL